MNKDTKLPYSEKRLRELTERDEIMWEPVIEYIYTLGTAEPIDQVVVSASAQFGEFILRFSGSCVYFHYNSIVLGYINISPAFATSIEENGYRLVFQLKSVLDSVMEI